MFIETSHSAEPVPTTEFVTSDTRGPPLKKTTYSEEAEANWKGQSVQLAPFGLRADNVNCSQGSVIKVECSAQKDVNTFGPVLYSAEAN